MESFEEQINEIHNLKLKQDRDEYQQRQINGESVYSEFCIWCNAFNKSQGKDDPEIFGKFLKEENIELNFWQKKHIAEKYFNWIYEWDYLKEKWNIKKKIKVNI